MTDHKSLRSIAEGATAGPWKAVLRPSRAWQIHGQINPLIQRHRGAICNTTSTYSDEGRKGSAANALYIATFDPPTALSLLDRITQLESAISGAAEALDQIIHETHEGKSLQSRQINGVAFRARRALHLTEETTDV